MQIAQHANYDTQHTKMMYIIQMGNRNASNNRRPGQGVRNNNAKFGGPIKGGGIRKRNPVDRAKKVLAKNAASKDPDTPADSNDKPKER